MNNTELISKLREGQTYDFNTGESRNMSSTMDDAADALEALEAEVGRLNMALHGYQVAIETAEESLKDRVALAMEVDRLQAEVERQKVCILTLSENIQHLRAEKIVMQAALSAADGKRVADLNDLTLWLDSLGGEIHTYSLRGIALAAWEMARANIPQQAQPERAPIVWPKEKDVGRFGDMSPSAHLRVGLDTDNDAYVSVWDEKGGATIEFCNPSGGGGKSSRTRMACVALMVAIEADNAERPELDWWARRMGIKQGGQHD